MAFKVGWRLGSSWLMASNACTRQFLVGVICSGCTGYNAWQDFLDTDGSHIRDAHADLHLSRRAWHWGSPWAMRCTAQYACIALWNNNMLTKRESLVAET